MMKIRYLNNEKGVALITSIMLLSLLTIIGFSAMNSSDIELRIAGNERASTRAFNLAEAGIEHAFAKLSADGNFSDFSSYTDTENPHLYIPQNGLLGSGNYNVWLTYDPTDDFIKFTSQGSGGGNSVATIEVEIRSNKEDVDIPGPISCINGPCIINYDTGGGSPNDPNVSGEDHDPPENFNCTGSACRQYDFSEDNNIDALPAIYLDDGGDILQGSNVVFWGGDPVENVDGGKEIYNTSEWPGYYDRSRDINDIGTRDNPRFSEISMSGERIERGAGILIINGAPVAVDEDPNDLLIGGTSFFEGLIIITNCGVLTANGTPHIYGAVRVDIPTDPDTGLSKCGDDYSPFAGNGRPAVLYSSKALENAFGTLLVSNKMTNWKQL